MAAHLIMIKSSCINTLSLVWGNCIMKKRLCRMRGQILFMRWTRFQPLKDALHIFSLPLLQVSEPELLNSRCLHTTEWRSYSSLVPLEQQTGCCRHRLPCLSHSRPLNHSTQHVGAGSGLTGLSMIPCWPQALFFILFCCEYFVRECVFGLDFMPAGVNVHTEY